MIKTNCANEEVSDVLNLVENFRRISQLSSEISSRDERIVYLERHIKEIEIRHAEELKKMSQKFM